MIEAINLSKRFDSKWVLKDLNLKIKKGEFYCFLGPNGAGKTTTLKIFTGLIKPTSGRALIEGKDIFLYPTQVKKIIGYIPDFPFLYEALTVREFLEFVGEIFDIEKKVLNKRIEYYLEIFNIKDKQDFLIKELSHGTKQRVVYISNFIHTPKVLFIDEPLVGLDPYTINLVKKLLKEQTKKGVTIFMCTHILNIAEELADRIGILDEGRLIAQGNIDELRKLVPAQKLEEIFLKLTEK